MNAAARPPVFRRLLQWLVLLAFILLALFCLYSAIHSAWGSRDAAGTYSPGMLRLAAGQLCFALASVSFGLGLFKGVQTFPGATSGAAALIVLAAMLALGPYIGRFVLVDACQDRGGSWNRVTLECSDE